MHGPREVVDLLGRHGLDPSRALGQNFVVDASVVERVAREARVCPGDLVVEVGPGLGALSSALAATGASVVAVEKDGRLVPVLREELARHGIDDRVDVVEGDALGVDWEDLIRTHRPAERGSVAVVANLPYNVAVPIVMSVLVDAPSVRRLVVMVQREVAERLAAGPGGRTVGVPSVRVAWHASARVVAEVPPESFHPPPRVTSAVLELERRPPPRGDVGEERVMDLVARAYRQRRKMLRSTLGSVVPAAAFAAAGVEPTDRPEQLTVAQWADLAAAAGR